MLPHALVQNQHYLSYLLPFHSAGGVGVAARRGSVAVLVRAAVLAQTQFLAAEVCEAGQGLVLLEVPFLAAVPIAAPAVASRAVRLGVAIRNLAHAEALFDLPPVLVALALLARPLAVAAPPAQVSLL